MESLDVKAFNIVTVKDNKKIILASIKKALRNAETELITGGVSVGDYDFVGPSLIKLGVKDIFYKIKQKPGKPLFFGKHGNTLVYGLPGNPAAVLSCFYEYVHPAIRIMQGRKDVFLKKVLLKIDKSYKKKNGLSHFLKARVNEESVTPLEGQESFMLSSFAAANALIYLPEERENINVVELVEMHLWPGRY